MSELAHIPLSSIVTGSNPRRRFDPIKMNELTLTMKSQGFVLSPILVRPFDEGLYQIIAGERRYRAAKVAFGDDYAIPAQVISRTDQEAAEAALIENVQREAMNPAEEAEAAARLLSDFANDRDEVAKRLGMSRQTLDSRLGLMNAADDVRQALIDGKILLGHAELLAAVEKGKQSKVLVGLLAQNPTPSVAQVKEMLAKVARSLETACFDKSACGACPHNSNLQASMFTDSIATGNCTGVDCFTAKTEAALESLRLSLVDAWPRVEVMRPGTNYTTIKLKVEGSDGVGEEQGKACRQCKNFGAAISAVPGKEGRVFEDFCFDTPCNSRMVARNLKAQSKEAAAAKTPPSGSPNKGLSAKAMASGATKPATVSLSSAVIEYRKKLWRKALAAEIGLSTERSLSMLAALAAAGKGGKLDTKQAMGVATAALQSTGPDTAIEEDFASALQGLGTLSKEVLAGAVLKLAATAAINLDICDVSTALRYYQCDLAKYFSINAEYLDLLTKSEMQSVATEVGLGKAFGEKFKSLFTEKKPELIKKLVAVQGFDFAVVPKALHFDTPEKA